MNDYEKKRLENIKSNNEMLKALGLDQVVMPMLDDHTKGTTLEV